MGSQAVDSIQQSSLSMLECFYISIVPQNILVFVREDLRFVKSNIMVGLVKNTLPNYRLLLQESVVCDIYIDTKRRELTN